MPGQENVFGIPVLQDAGSYAVRVADDDLWAAAEAWSDDDPAEWRRARIVRDTSQGGF